MGRPQKSIFEALELRDYLRIEMLSETRANAPPWQLCGTHPNNTGQQEDGAARGNSAFPILPEKEFWGHTTYLLRRLGYGMHLIVTA